MIDYAQQRITNHIDVTAWIRRHGMVTILLGLVAWAVTSATGYVAFSLGKTEVNE